jgi:hypothetical protein
MIEKGFNERAASLEPFSVSEDGTYAQGSGLMFARIAFRTGTKTGVG